LGRTVGVGSAILWRGEGEKKTLRKWNGIDEIACL